MSDITIRPVEDGDLTAVRAIYAHAVETGLASFELDPPDLAEMTRRRDAILAAGYPYRVAEAGGRVLGYAYAGPYRTRPAYRHTVENSVYVAHDARGLGVGRRLLEALIADCEARGFRQMIAVIGDSGNAASIALHRAAGFDLIGILPAVGYKFDRWVDSVLMQRPLGPGRTTPPER